jgi:hypothetical protein
MKRIALLLTVAACGSKSPPAQPEPPKKFEDMNKEQRLQFMKEVVLPRTKAAFVEFDPKYESMDCATCHGDGATDGTFDMPNPKLPVLPGSEEAFMAWIGQDAEAARYTEFMFGTLEPLMGELLQVKVFDPKTGTGDFSCDDCHTLTQESP